MGGLVDLLAARREDIIQCFGHQLRELSDAPGPTLLDSLPALLDALEAALRAPGALPSALARRGERPVERPADSGGLARRVRELGLLRDCLLTLLEEPGGVRAEEQRALHHWLDGAVLDAVARWEEARDAELRRTAEYRDRFLGVAGHDLRNPLNAILLSATTLLRDESLPERTVRGLKRMASSAERLGRMIGELLDFTRGRLGAGLALHRKPVDLGAVCRGVVEGLEAATSPGALSLDTEGDVSGEWDADRVTQLVGHLVRSALDASPKDTPVTLRLRGEEDAVRLEVHPGAPLSEAVLPVLFEPFHREARAALGTAPSGLGLGLYLARQLALAHGGTLETRTTPEEGTTFTLRLPRRTP